MVILDCACPIQLLETKQAKAKKKKKVVNYLKTPTVSNALSSLVYICLFHSL
jgi:hypothetical protein